MITEQKKRIFYVLTAVILVAVLCSTVTSLFTAKAVYELRSEKDAATQTKEDNVPIMNDQFEIRSTLAISDAYKSGSDAGLDEKQKETLTMASAVLDEIITKDMSNYDKEKAVYDWMSTKLTYDTGVLQVIPKTSSDADNPYGTLKYHNAVCVGYATTFRLFMQMLDIECMVVHNKEAYHSWDLVKLDDEWYHVDIYSDQGTGSYANFNLNDEQRGSAQDWDRTFFPAATGTKYNYAILNKKPLKNIYDLPNQIRTAMDEKKGFLSFSFEVMDEAHAQIVESIFNNLKSYTAASANYSDLFVNHSWLHVSGTEYVLSIQILGFKNNEDDAKEVPAEAQEKVDRALTNAFGEPTESGGMSDSTEINTFSNKAAG